MSLKTRLALNGICKSNDISTKLLHSFILQVQNLIEEATTTSQCHEEVRALEQEKKEIENKSNVHSAVNTDLPFFEEGNFNVSKYFFPDFQATSKLVIEAPHSFKNLKVFVNCFKSIAEDLCGQFRKDLIAGTDNGVFPYLIPRQILTSVVALFASQYPHIDVAYKNLQEPANSRFKNISVST